MQILKKITQLFIIIFVFITIIISGCKNPTGGNNPEGANNSPEISINEGSLSINKGDIKLFINHYISCD